MKLKYLLLSLILIVFVAGCNSPNKYLNDALDIMEENSINKDSIDWIQLRKNVFKRAEKVQSVEETYPAIKYALKQLRDNHSFLMTVESQEKVYDKNNLLPKIDSELIKDSIAYIKMPAFMGDSILAYEYANKLNNILKDLDNKYISGWIIDLRENGGGNMWPMLLGIGPIIETDTVGYFVDTEKKYSEWIYSKGEVLIGKNKIMSLPYPHNLLNKNRKKAILISRQTASSGEAIAVAFKGSEKTMFFGQNTRGLSTANQGFKLSDGAMIFLTVSKFADKNKNIYGTPIEPDYIGFNAKENAINWITHK